MHALLWGFRPEPSCAYEAPAAGVLVGMGPCRIWGIPHPEIPCLPGSRCGASR